MLDEMGGTSDDTSIDFRVSLRNSAPNGSFIVTLHSRFARLTLGDLINTVFLEDAAAFAENIDAADIKANPDLPDIYLDLSDVFDTWRRGECALHFFEESGPEIQLSQPVANYLRPVHVSQGTPMGSRVLDIVVEQTFDVLAHYEERGGDKNVLLQWFQSMTLLYFIDKHVFELRLDTPDENVQRVLPFASDLLSMGILSASESDLTGRLEISEEGRRVLGDMIAETESYIDRYDIFKDVAYDLDAETVEFGNGRGADYRVQVYDAEGLDIYRAVFLLRMYDGTLDGHLDNWLVDIHNAEFFNDVLRPVLDREWVDDEIIDWIMDSGFAHNEEQVQAKKERESQQAIIKRIPLE